MCATIDELPNELGQPVGRTEPVVLMLIDVRWVHFYSSARRKMFVELLEEACTDKSKVGRSLDPLDTTTVCNAFECWAGSWNGPLMTSPGRQMLDMQSSSGNRSA